jgi:bifunctional DNA-binding transcriptional regulator/antitoxin component of YhaV-PrlF toxin-antitoxin module
MILTGTRKAITTKSSITIAIPREWARSNNIEKGCELDFVADEVLIIIPPKHKDKLELVKENINKIL